MPSSFTSSPPPTFVRSTILLIFERVTSWSSGIPPTVVAETTGTIWSPWPPSTMAVTSFTERPVSCAMKHSNRDVSSTPAIPTTRSRGNPDTALATWHIASSGFETITRTAFFDRFATSRVTSATIASFVFTRSSRLIPGLRGRPAVITITSEPAVAA